MIKLTVEFIECDSCGGHANLKINRPERLNQTEAEEHLLDLSVQSMTAALAAHGIQRAAIIEERKASKATAELLAGFAVQDKPPTNEKLD